jgi:outer membrane protein assembly factor BamB
MARSMSGGAGLYSINRDGGLNWKLGAGSFVQSSPAAGADGTVYVGSNDSNLYAMTEE